jgi:hypothetical protein
MNRLAIALVASIFAGAAGAAEPATVLSAQKGTVLVNQGEEFVTASDLQSLKAGDRVMVMEGGDATVTFGDGCVLPVVSGSIVEIPAASTCAGSVATTQRIGPSYAQAVGEPRYYERNSNAAVPWVFGGLALALALWLHTDDYEIHPELPVSP